jgi:hypothetical protein
LKNLSIAAISACLLVGYGGYAICDAEVHEPGSAPLPPTPTPTPKPAAAILVQQLSGRPEVREKAATALQAMGKTAASALAAHISNSVELLKVSNAEPADGVTKAITVLAKIGKDVADDEEVRKALVSAAKIDARADDWPRLQLKLAAIDALGEINKYRSGILEKEVSFLSFAVDFANPTRLVERLRPPSTNLVSQYLWSRFSAEDQKVLQDPTSGPAEQRATLAVALNKILTGASIYDHDRFATVKLSSQTEALASQNPKGESLIRLNRRLIKEAYPVEIRDLREVLEAADGLAETARDIFKQATVRAPLTPTPAVTVRASPTPSPTASPDTDFLNNLLVLHDSQAALVKLADDVNPEASPSNKKTSEATPSKLGDEKTLAACLRKIEVGYLDATKTTFSDTPARQRDDKSRLQLKAEAAYDLMTETKQLSDQLQKLQGDIGDLQKNRDALNGVISELGGISDKPSSYLVKVAVGNALNAIFSKPPKKKPAAEGAKKEETKKDSEKKEDDKKATDKKDSDKKDSDNTEVEEDETANE